MISKTVFLLTIIAVFLAGMAIGNVVTELKLGAKAVGTLRVDNSDSDSQPFLFLELDLDGMQKVQSKKTVMLRVSTENYLPRE